MDINLHLPRIDDSHWKAELSPTWDLLGPFPAHAREQHFISPSFPLNLSRPYKHEPDKTWFSSLVDHGAVSWRTVQSDELGTLSVSFPNVRWNHLRATEGWAILQYHAVLHTTLTVIPPANRRDNEKPPRLHINLSRTLFFTLLSRETVVSSDTLQFNHAEWHTGNVFDLRGACPSSVELPSLPNGATPSAFDLFICGDYEIRLFGDPRALGIEDPTLELKISVQTEDRKFEVVRDSSIDVFCDFVAGYAFGDCIGLGLRSIDGWWTVRKLESARSFPSGMSLFLLSTVTLAPSQRRLVPIRLSQRSPCYEDTLKFAVHLSAENEMGYTVFMTVPVIVKFKHHRIWTTNEGALTAPIQASFLYALSQPTSFLVIPPMLGDVTGNRPRVPILALHGAGVDIFVDDFWINSLNRQRYHWTIVAIGRTEWGFDWHGPSASEAWATVDALEKILKCWEHWKSWTIDPTRVVLMGHSNGGQGTWYLASRYPDRVVAAIPAAAYLKSQTYVPLTHSRSSHFIDPALRGILEASSSGDDNDLFLSNIVGIPLLAVHGGDDGNVPTWHTREYVSTALEWADKSGCKRLISYHEDLRMPHWYGGVFSTPSVQNFMDCVLSDETNRQRMAPHIFTLTVSEPSSCGAMYGWRILRLKIPGRLGRLTVVRSQRDDDIGLSIRTINVGTVSVRCDQLTGVQHLYIDNSGPFGVDLLAQDTRIFTRSPLGIWENSVVADVIPSRHGRAQNILVSKSSLKIVIPSDGKVLRAESIALRLAHALDIYLRLDSHIVTDKQSLDKGKSIWDQRGNVVIIGGYENAYGRKLLEMGLSEFGIHNEKLAFRGDVLNDPELGVIFTHPHPTCRESLVLFLVGNSATALERMFRLFPIRTGVPVPDWVLAGEESDRVGVAGFTGAGIWDNDWKWNEAMSWYL